MLDQVARKLELLPSSSMAVFGLSGEDEVDSQTFFFLETVRIVHLQLWEEPRARFSSSITTAAPLYIENQLHVFFFWRVAFTRLSNPFFPASNHNSGSGVVPPP